MSRQSNSPAGLAQVSTRWSSINNPQQFMLCYALAVHDYLAALLPEPYDAEDAFQKFCLRMVQTGFARASPDRGRFRDYLKKSVRNFALNYRRDHPSFPGAIDFAQVTDDAVPSGDAQWLADWQRTLLNRAWRGLEAHQEQAGNLAYTVLRLAADHADDNSNVLAQRVSQLIGKPYGAGAFRKQLSRARRLFADLLRYEVAQTVDDATPEAVDEELIETGLMPYLRDLPRE